jgi:hypothetical protein
MSNENHIAPAILSQARPALPRSLSVLLRKTARRVIALYQSTDVFTPGLAVIIRAKWTARFVWIGA